MKAKRLTAEQFRRLILSEAAVAIDEIKRERAAAAKPVTESAKRPSKTRGQLIVESAIGIARLADGEYGTLDQVLSGCVWLGEHTSYSDINSDVLISKIPAGMIAQLPKKIDEGVATLKTLGLDPNVERTAVRYLRSLV